MLIDTGSNKNYIHPKHVKLSHKVDKPFFVSSVAGDIKIDAYSQARLFQPYSDKMLKFYHLENLKSFDAIIGHDSLKEIKAVIDTANEILIIDGTHTIPLQQYRLQEVNKINIRDNHLNQNEKGMLHDLLQEYQDLFQPPDSKLPFTSQVKATISTKNETPVYSKTYPYPQALKGEVNRQVEKLLTDGIIRP